MNKIPLDLLIDLINEIDKEQGESGKITVPLEELYDRLIAKGWHPYPSDETPQQKVE